MGEGKSEDMNSGQLEQGQSFTMITYNAPAAT